MEPLNSSSLGAMGSLLSKLDELLGERAPGLISDLRVVRTKMEKLSEVHSPIHTVKYWMNDARELSYEMEVCVDLFLHASQPEALSAKVRWILAWTEEILEYEARVKEVNERCERYNLVNRYVLNNPEKIVASQQLHTLYEEPDPVGMEEHTNKLVEWLKPKGHGEDEVKLNVISVLGDGGVGKSTLVKRLWRVSEGKFDCRAFVQTAKKADMRMILRSILSQVHPKEPSEASKMPNLIHDLREHLQDKRYFIVIDDIWDISVWHIVRRAFPDSNCRIITTTAVENVARACSSYDPNNTVNVCRLLDDQAKKLFIDSAFGSRKGCPPKFKDVMDKVTRKCGGLSLAIIYTARLVASQPENEQEQQLNYVNNFLPNNLGTHSSSVEILDQVLKLCYISLPPCVRTCLLYLSVYPENYLFLKEDLVKQWIAEDFICTSEGKDITEVAGSYFDDLLNLGLIQRMNIVSSNKKGLFFYTVHPVVFDFITCKSMEDNFVTMIDYSQSTVVLTENVRRLSLHFGSATYASTPASVELSQVRSLVFMGLLDCIPSIGEFKLIRVVILHIRNDDGDTRFSLAEICKLLLLRYLQVRSNATVVLPDQIGCLKLLETLEINAEVAGVPSDILHHPRLLHVRLGTEPKHRYFTSGDVSHVTSGEAIFQDVLGSCSSPSSPAFKEFELLPPICIFSELPRWFQQLQKLCILEIVVRKLSMSDIDILGELPALAALSLYVRAPTSENVVFRPGAFPALGYFKFMCGVSLLEFQEEAVPSLRTLQIYLNAQRGENYGHKLDGIQHLLSRQDITGSIGVTTGSEETYCIAVEFALVDSIGKYPGGLNFKVEIGQPVDKQYEPPETHEWSPGTESSHCPVEEENQHSDTLTEDSFIDQTTRSILDYMGYDGDDHTATNIWDMMAVEDGKKDTETGISGLSNLNEVCSSTLQKSGVVLRYLTFKFLEFITNGFSKDHKEGSGVHGQVYKGVMDDGEVVAVKKLYPRERRDDHGLFMNECNYLMMVQHHNIVRLVGYCYEVRHKGVQENGEYNFDKIEEKALCFEYFAHGSLDKHLSDELDGLDWSARYKIISGICDGINYLHGGLDTPILHLNLKPTNILVDKNMVAKIADYGFSIREENHTQEIYMPPEYISDGIFSRKYDVFSLGIIIIQIITGYNSIDELQQGPLEQVQANWRNRIVATSSMHVEEYCKQVKSCIEISFSCLEVDRHKRPMIGDIVNKLIQSETKEQLFERRHVEKAANMKGNAYGPDAKKSDSVRKAGQGQTSIRLPPRSEIWKHFTLINDGNVDKYIRCNYCRREWVDNRAKIGTFNIARHIKDFCGPARLLHN